MLLQKGFRSKLDAFFDLKQPIMVDISIDCHNEIDICCFGVDEFNRLSDDKYLIFYNQLNSPENAITMQLFNNSSKTTIYLDELPSKIKKLAFTINIDGNLTMSSIKSGFVKLSQNNKEVLELNLNSSNFTTEKSVIIIEIYEKNGWRFGAIASGFNGGLLALLKDFSCEEIIETSKNITIQKLKNTNITTPLKIDEQNKIAITSLEKKLEKSAPKLFNLAKPLETVLEKNDLTSTIAKVALILDISGSMEEKYKNGTVQMIINKMLPLAVQFDDNSELDFWYYGSNFKRVEAITMENYEEAVPKDYTKLMSLLGYGNNEALVMQDIIKEYKNSKIPAYIIFITDGGVGSTTKIKNCMIESSKYPIFWQFIGIGGYGYGILKRLDTMSDRKVDNANFFALDDFKTVTNEELYSRMLNKFPIWLEKSKGLEILKS